MATKTGIAAIGGYAQVDYATVTTAPTDVVVEIAKLEALIPDPDAPPTAARHAANMLDMMPPIVAGQLLAELTALKTALATSL